MFLLAFSYLSHSIEAFEPATVYGGTISPGDIDTNTNKSLPLINSTTAVPVPNPSPLGEEEYRELKEKAKSGELVANRNVTTPPIEGGGSLEELVNPK